MDERIDSLVSGSLLIFFGVLLALQRWGVLPVVVLRDVWPAVLILAGFVFLYLYFRQV